MRDKVRAFGYARVSGVGQIEGDGFERQADVIGAYASKHGVEIVELYREEGVSGTKAESERPAFQAMVAEILRDGVRTIVIERLDRLAREYRVQESLIVYLASKGIDLIVATTEENVTEAIHADPMKKALIQIQGVFSELDKNMLVKKLRVARERKRAKTGKCEGRKSYREVPEGQKIIKTIQNLRRRRKGSRKWSYADVAEELNRQGITTLTGRTWTRERVFQALQG